MAPRSRASLSRWGCCVLGAVLRDRPASALAQCRGSGYGPAVNRIANQEVTAELLSKNDTGCSENHCTEEHPISRLAGWDTAAAERAQISKNKIAPLASFSQRHHKRALILSRISRHHIHTIYDIMYTATLRGNFETCYTYQVDIGVAWFLLKICSCKTACLSALQMGQPAPGYSFV
jgi:hypothetical protein